MKMMSKIVCSALMLCGAFCIPTTTVYATGDILIDEPMDFVLAPDTKRVINNKKVSDHHGIIPTAELANTDISSVPDGEKKILYLIANRLLCATSEPYIYETVTAEISCGGYSFVARGRNVISEGCLKCSLPIG